MREIEHVRGRERMPRLAIVPDTSTYLVLNQNGDQLTSLDLERAPPEVAIEAIIDRLKVLQTQSNSRYRDLAIGGLVCALTALEEGTEQSSTTVSGQ